MSFRSSLITLKLNHVFESSYENNFLREEEKHLVFRLLEISDTKWMHAETRRDVLCQGSDIGASRHLIVVDVGEQLADAIARVSAILSFPLYAFPLPFSFSRLRV